jgi:hypothetical protein
VSEDLAALSLVFHFHHCDPKMYRPTLECLHETSGFRFALHLDGPLLSWMLDNDDDGLRLVREMVANGSAEIVGGCMDGLPAAGRPQAELNSQVEAMANWCEKHMKQYPMGVWLSDGRWQPALAEALAQAGALYTIVAAERFTAAGVERPCTHYVAHHNGFGLTVFPDYCGGNTGELIEFMRANAPIGLTYSIDGDGQNVDWLRGLFQKLQGNSEWLFTLFPSSVTIALPSNGRVDLPATGE